MASSMTVTKTTVRGQEVSTSGTGNLGTYAANGIAVTAAQCGLGAMDDLEVDPAGGYVFQYVKSTGKVKTFLNKDPAASGGADLAMPEVGSVDISAAIFNWRARGV